jgi:hypothetical protein
MVLLPASDFGDVVAPRTYVSATRIDAPSGSARDTHRHRSPLTSPRRRPVSATVRNTTRAVSRHARSSSFLLRGGDVVTPLPLDLPNLRRVEDAPLDLLLVRPLHERYNVSVHEAPLRRRGLDRVALVIPAIHDVRVRRGRT